MLPVTVEDVDGHPHPFGRILLVRPQLASLPPACGYHVAFELYCIIDTTKLTFSSIRRPVKRDNLDEK